MITNSPLGAHIDHQWGIINGLAIDNQFAVDKCGIKGDAVVMAGDNLLDFSLREFVAFAEKKGTSCVMCHEENDLKKKQKTAIITLDADDKITSYENVKEIFENKQ